MLRWSPNAKCRRDGCGHKGWLHIHGARGLNVQQPCNKVGCECAEFVPGPGVATRLDVKEYGAILRRCARRLKEARAVYHTALAEMVARRGLPMRYYREAELLNLGEVDAASAKAAVRRAAIGVADAERGRVL